MNRFRAVLLLAGAVITLTACDNQAQTSTEPGESIESQKEAIYQSSHADDHYLRQVDRAEPTWAGVSHSTSTWAISKDYVVEITDTETLQFIVDDIIEGSNRVRGIVDIGQPYYDLTIDYSDGSSETFHLWISEDSSSGTLMDTMNTHFIYTFSNEVSERFLSLLPDDAVLDSPEYSEWIDGRTFGLTQSLEPYLTIDLDDLISHSEYIVQGTYLSADPSDVPESWGDDSFEYFSFEVSDVLKGDLDREMIEVGHPEYVITWATDPESGEDLGTVRTVDPIISRPDPEKEVILFLSMQNEPGEFWRFSEPTMVEVHEDGSLTSMSPAFDPDFDTSDRIETYELDGDWELELTLTLPSSDLPVDDPFASMTRDELLKKIN